MRTSIKLIAVIAALFFVQSCRYDKIDIGEQIETASYPDDIGTIMLTRCATTGCHTANDNQLAGGLDLSSWDAMFRGARNGSPVVPFSAQYSFLCYFINSYSDLGITNIQAGNIMPPTGDPLSHEEVEKIINWINEGARNNDGAVKFPDSFSRRKIYVANAGCDEVTVIDAASGQIMRYVSVGADPQNIEKPHQIKISPDGNFWYIVFLAGDYLQKFSTFDDSFIGQAFLDTNGSWNSMAITPDGLNAFLPDWGSGSFNARVLHVNLQTMTREHTFVDASVLDLAHGSYYMHTDSFLYVTSENNNRVFKFDFHGDPGFTFVNQPPIPINMPPGSRPHEILFTPDESKYFVTCGGTNEVRVFNAANDVLQSVIPVGATPLEMAISPSRHLLFITCQDDSTSSQVQAANLERGSVFVYDYANGQLVPINIVPDVQGARVSQPHGISVDEADGKVFVGSRNVSSFGPAPHHSSGCGARNGFITAIDLTDLEFVSFTVPDFPTYLYKSELLGDPYAVTAK